MLQYRRQAEEMRVAAAKTKARTLRACFLDIAERYEDLAAYFEIGAGKRAPSKLPAARKSK